jgi:biopolymer transport protein ExbB
VDLNGALLQFTQADNLGQLNANLQEIGGSEARVLIAGLAAADKGALSVEEALAAAASIERMRRERLIFLLGTVGANAPFIGLLGTVLGIIKAFQDLAMNQAEAASAVMAGISEALVATAVGLLVAIPAVILFNLFQRANRRFLGRVESASHVLLAYMKAEPATPLAPSATAEA